MTEMLQAAKAAKPKISLLTTDEKNKALLAMADALIAQEDNILAANAADITDATGTISTVMLDRLRLTPERIAGMAQGIRDVAGLPDPVGLKLDEYIRTGYIDNEETKALIDRKHKANLFKLQLMPCFDAGIEVKA